MQPAPAHVVGQPSQAELLAPPAPEREPSDAADDVCYTLDGPSGRLLHISPAYARLWGRSCESLHANPASYLDAIHADDRAAVATAMSAHRAASIAHQSQHRMQEYRLIQPDGQVRWVQHHTWHLFDDAGQLARVLGTVRDITASKHAQVALARSTRALHLLAQCHRALSLPGTEQALLDNICRLAVEVGGYRLAWVGYARDDAGQRIEPMAHAGHEDGYLSVVELTWAEPATGGGLASEAIRRCSIRQCPDVAAADTSLPWPQEALKRGYRSILVLPLCRAGQVFGMLALYSAEAETASPDELALLQELVDHVALGIDSLRLREWRGRLKAAVVTVAAGVSAHGDPDFLAHLLRQLTTALGAQAAWVLQLQPGQPGQGRSVAAVVDGQVVDNFDLLLATSPCQQLLASPSVILPDHLDSLYPEARWPNGLVGKAYLGHRLEDASGQLTGCISVLFREPAPMHADLMLGALQIFASRAGAELARLHADLDIRRLNASLQERVQQRTAELQLANQELESFCYSVSHDLRSPLSAVDGFASLLEQSMQALPVPMAGRGQHYLQRIRAGVVQMGELIDALLMLARVARVPLQPEQLDLSALATELLSALRERQPNRPVQLQVQPGLFAWGDARLLRQMLDHLLDNAWKFSAGQTLCQIEFGCEAPADARSQPVYFVRDNGAGFNMAYAQKLFGPFQRLHSPSEFEGTGVGLATVQRIVARHGGQVWGEAALNAGATFRFTLAPQLSP